MILDEALSQAVEGARVTAPHMQPGCYVEHSLSRGFLRCWKVDKPEDEPNRTQCDFIPHDGDRAADWRILESEEQYPPKPKLTGGWGAMPSKPVNDTPLAKALHTIMQPGFGKTKAPPVADVIDLSADAPAPTWAKPLDPRKGGW